jgi:hypothetical protein
MEQACPENWVTEERYKIGCRAMVVCYIAKKKKIRLGIDWREHLRRTEYPSQRSQRPNPQPCTPILGPLFVILRTLGCFISPFPLHRLYGALYTLSLRALSPSLWYRRRCRCRWRRIDVCIRASRIKDGALGEIQQRTSCTLAAQGFGSGVGPYPPGSGRDGALEVVSEKTPCAQERVWVVGIAVLV